MTEELQTLVLAMVLVTICCVCHGCGRVDMEKQAIGRGYATYDNNGCFVWKEHKE